MGTTVKSTDGVSVPNMETIDTVPNDPAEILGKPMIRALDAAKAKSEGKVETQKMETAKDVLAERWHELKGRVQERWAELTDDDLEHLSGSADALADSLQERYGFAKAKFEAEISEWVRDVQAGPPNRRATPKVTGLGHF